MNIPAAKAAVDKEWVKLEKILAWNLTKVRSKKWSMARGMGSPRHVDNRRRRTREGPAPACVRAPFHLWGGTRREGRMNQHPAMVPSSRRGKNLQWDAKEEELGCPQG